MIIIINKDFSVARVTPSSVNQGSNLANELTVFAPFSISSYASIIATFKLPSSEYIEPLVAFATAEQPQGFGAWSVLLPASVTAIPGTVKFSLSFIGSGDVRMVTGEAEFTVNASVPSVLPETPSVNIYEDILAALSSILQRHPDWAETNSANHSYIANKPPIVQLFDTLDALKGAKVNGDLNVTGGLTVDELSIFSELVTALNGFLVTGGLMVDGVDFSDKLTKSSKSNVVYANIGQTVSTIPFDNSAEGDTIVRRTSSGTITSKDPSTFSDSDLAVNTRYFNANSVTQITYDAPTGVLSLKKRDGTVIGSTNLPLDSIVSDVEYDDTAENLVITFTNGQTTVIPLQILLLPAWVSDLNNVPSGSGNVPPTANAVKTYVDSNTASAIKGEVSGGAILLDDISPLNNTVRISTSPNVSNVGIFGRNLVISNQIVKATNASKGTLTVEGNQIILGENTIYGISVELPNPIPAGTVVSYSFEWSSDSVDDNEKFDVIQFGSAQSSNEKTLGTQKGSFLPDFEMTRFRIFKKSPATPSTTPIYISNLCLNIGTEAVFTPFENKIDLQLTNGRGTYTAEGGRDISIIPPTESTVTAEYYRDSTKVINKLSRQIIALQNIVT